MGGKRRDDPDVWGALRIESLRHVTDASKKSKSFICRSVSLKAIL